MREQWNQTGKICRGIVPALVTPFDKAGEPNHKVLRQLIHHVVEGGVHGVFLVGTTGEFYALSMEEKQGLFETAVAEVNGAIPVYAGTGGTTTREAIRLTRLAKNVGVDAVSVLTPLFIRPSDQELFDHYAAIAASAEIPVLLYGNPGRTGISLSSNVVSRLAQIDNIVGIKDSSGDLSQTMAYVQCTNSEFSVMAGRDTLIYATLCCGGAGAIAATANIVPSLVVRIYNAFMRGDHVGAQQAQIQLAPLRMAFSLGTFPQVMKEAVQVIGIDVGSARPPVGRLTRNERSELEEAIRIALTDSTIQCA